MHVFGLECLSKDVSFTTAMFVWGCEVPKGKCEIIWKPCRYIPPDGKHSWGNAVWLCCGYDALFGRSGACSEFWPTFSTSQLCIFFFARFLLSAVFIFFSTIPCALHAPFYENSSFRRRDLKIMWGFMHERLGVFFCHHVRGLMKDAVAWFHLHQGLLLWQPYSYIQDVLDRTWSPPVTLFSAYWRHFSPGSKAAGTWIRPFTSI